MTDCETDRAKFGGLENFEFHVFRQVSRLFRVRSGLYRRRHLKPAKGSSRYENISGSFVLVQFYCLEPFDVKSTNGICLCHMSLCHLFYKMYLSI